MGRPYRSWGSHLGSARLRGPKASSRVVHRRNPWKKQSGSVEDAAGCVRQRSSGSSFVESLLRVFERLKQLLESVLLRGTTL